MVGGRTDFRFSRREVREHTGWGHTQLKVHLHRLEELEYLIVHSGGRGQSLRVRTELVGVRRGEVGGKSAPSRGDVGGWSGLLRPA